MRHWFVILAFAGLLGRNTHAALAAQGFLVESTEECPDQAAIEGSLLSINEQPHEGTVRVALHNNQLEIEWHETQKQPAKRLLPAFDRCDDRAHAVAIVLAAIWSTPANPAGEQIPAGPPTQVAKRQPPASSLRTETMPNVFAFGALGAIDGNSAGWGVRADLTKAELAARLGLILGAEFTAPRMSSLGDGKARWNRASLMIGPTFTALSGPRWAVTGEAAGALSLWLAHGDGFDKERRNFSIAPGASVAVRSMFRVQPVHLFVEMRTLAWPGARAFQATDEPSGQVHRTSLSSWEMQLNLGVAFSVRP